jgi:hypothetical protein
VPDLPTMKSLMKSLMKSVTYGELRWLNHTYGEIIAGWGSSIHFTKLPFAFLIQ